MTTKAELEAAIRRVHEHRVNLVSVTQDETDKKALMEACFEWKQFEACRKLKGEFEAVIKDSENEVRALALALYAETQDKHPADGVTVKVFTKLAYELDKATAWARAAMPALLKLDTKAFEKIAKSGLPGVEDMPVTITEEPRAELASAL